MTPSISTTQLSYTVDGLLAAVPNRLDGRSFLAFRTLQLSTGVAPQAAGSAKCILGEGSTTTCTAVVSADVVQDEEASGSLLACTVDCSPSIPQSTSLQALFTTLHKALRSTLGGYSSAEHPVIPTDQLVILRSLHSPHQPTRAWKLNVDVEFDDIAGGNLADAMFASVHAALDNVRLPQTRVVGLDVQHLKNGNQTLDIFDVKGRKQQPKHTPANIPPAQQDGAPANQLESRIGVDYEIQDLWTNGVPLQGGRDFPVGATVNILPNGILLDATLTEEACIPSSRRLLVLCQPSSGQLAGTFNLHSTLDTGVSNTGEGDKNEKQRPFYGTCSYKNMLQAVQEGVQHATALHAAIRAQL